MNRSLSSRCRALRWRTPSLFTLGAGLAVASVAQTAPEPAASAPTAPALPSVVVKGGADESYAVRETTSATKLTLSPRETPQSLTVMTRERLDDQNLTSLRDVLDNTPGIYSYQYDTERVVFFSRGFAVDALMYDGLPAHVNFNTGSLDETLDTAFYERIEIVRGATGLMTGAGNPAAAVNLVRKRPDSKVFAASGTLSAGSWDTVRAEADVSTPLTADGNVRARFVAAGEKGSSYQDLYKRRKAAFYGIVEADLTPSTRVSLGADYQDNTPNSVTWGSFPMFLKDGQPANWPRSVTTATDWSFWDRTTKTVFGEVRHEFDNGWKLQGTLSHREYTEDLALFYLEGFPDATTGEGLTPYSYRSKARNDENALDLHASGPFQLFGRKHEVVAGYNGSREKNNATEQSPDGAVATPGSLFTWDGSYPQPAWGDAYRATDIKTDQDALYVATRLQLADPLKFIGGLRWVNYKIDSFYVYDSPNESRYDYSKVIPYAGLVWDVLPQVSAFTSYTGIFKPQAKRDINGGFLDPIEGRSIEFGLKGEHFDGRLNTAITVFQTQQDNVAGPVYDANGDAITLPDGSAANRAIDGTQTRGFEIEVTGQVTPELRGAFGWTRYLTKDGDDKPIRTYVPPTMVRLFATWEPRSLVEGLALGGGVNWQSKSNTTVGNPNGPYNLVQDSLATVQLMARYAITPNVSVQLNGNNVFDKTYYVLDEYGNTAYGAPARYTLSLRASY